MFNLGFSELIIIGVIALVFIGPKQLPEVARVIGRLINEWKRATSDFTSTFKDNDAFRDWEKRKNDYLSQLESSIQDPIDPKGPIEPFANTQANEQMELPFDEESSGKDKQ